MWVMHLANNRYGIPPVIRGGVLLLTIALFPRFAFADEDNSRTRREIIELVEDTLSEAYSFTPTSVHKVPHYEVLDRIFPGWHNGEPAVARDFWVVAAYRTFLVFYRVDYVHVVNSVTASVRGKRLVAWELVDGETDLKKYWPIQFWTHLTSRRYQANNYLHAIYAMRYQMKLTKTETGRWIIAEENFSSDAQIENKLSNQCTYMNQFRDWGLISECD